jgi:hypothetical protein
VAIVHACRRDLRSLEWIAVIALRSLAARAAANATQAALDALLNTCG